MHSNSTVQEEEEEAEERRPLLPEAARSKRAGGGSGASSRPGKGCSGGRRGEWRRRISGCAILCSVTLERLAFFSITANLYLFLNGDPLHWSSVGSMSASYVFTGVAYVTAVGGGWLADALLGRFRTLFVGLFLYAAAYAALVLLASYGHDVAEAPLCFYPSTRLPFPRLHPTTTTTPSAEDVDDAPWWWPESAAADPHGADFQSPAVRFFHVPENDDGLSRWRDHGRRAGGGTVVEEGGGACQWTIYVILVTLGVAVGAIRANIAPFGADQFLESNDVEEEEEVLSGGRRGGGSNGGNGEAMRCFFNYFYWCVNVGAFVALGFVAYVQQALDDGFFVGYLIPAAALGVGILVFLVARPFYVVQKPEGSVLVNVIRILGEARRSKRKRHRDVTEDQEESRRTTTTTTMPSTSASPPPGPPSWLDMAKVRYGGSFHEEAVDDVKSLASVILVFVALIPYWIVYFQMQTSFFAQGLHMKLNPKATPMDRNGNVSASKDITFTVPAAWLTLFDVSFLLLFLPLMERVVYPFLDRRHIHLSLLFRISLGMGFSLASVLLAGGLENYRLKLIQKSPPSEWIIQVLGNTSYAAADLSIFWQVPQYALIGVSEVFASVACLEFAYSTSPKSMQGLIMGLYCFCTGMGSFLGTGLLEAVRPFWFSVGGADEDDHRHPHHPTHPQNNNHSSNLNQSHLDYYFFLLAAIQLLTLLLFVAVARNNEDIDDVTHAHRRRLRLLLLQQQKKQLQEEEKRIGGSSSSTQDSS